MAIRMMRGTSDEIIEQILPALRAYEADHSEARIDLYRQNSVSVRVRIIDPAFARQGVPQRHAGAWQYLDRVPEEALSDISTLTLLAPDEIAKSFANMDFEDPVPSDL